MKNNFRGTVRRVDYGHYERSDEEFEAYRWCINNNIIIWPENKYSQKWKIEIRINGKSHLSPEEYGPVEIWVKIYEYYKYYFNKYKNGK